MYRPRVIPVLLLKNKGLVKTVKFNKSRYIGDPINAVKIFNDLEADELVFLDITASKEKRTISLDLVKEIGDEAFMPFAVGGGIKTLKDVEEILKAGAEKVVLNSVLHSNMNIISDVALKFGSQSVIASVDVKKNFFGKYVVYIKSGKKKIKTQLIDYVKMIESKGAGEIIINSIDNDGLMQGYDLELIKTISEVVDIPVIACGGAGNLGHFKEATQKSFASAVSAGSVFVYHGPRRGILINYPEKNELNKVFAN
ncbi:AglZ/HisF2 family acetamidino modification protein [Polaribacter aquimarinus]|uniref:imidazole glycerol-phosphate synthase n=1 Tax=Polaribacter aquimarinus TaxID=2100726 RepID=A0A2U2JAV7_9FLAO|nr:AglZ/HisF2 family acetamidino modification protein [Polaribacter aquimarinus]PWG05476.1 imidazole glycerol phosphate synthase subunit HisF [Polaribacter aquimarinus]